MERICRLLEDADNLRRNDPTNPTIREFDLDGVIDGCVGSLHMFRSIWFHLIFFDEGLSLLNL